MCILFFSSVPIVCVFLQRILVQQVGKRDPVASAQANKHCGYAPKVLPLWKLWVEEEVVIYSLDSVGFISWVLKNAMEPPNERPPWWKTTPLVIPSFFPLKSFLLLVLISIKKIPKPILNFLDNSHLQSWPLVPGTHCLLIWEMLPHLPALDLCWKLICFI